MGALGPCTVPRYVRMVLCTYLKGLQGLRRPLRATTRVHGMQEVIRSILHPVDTSVFPCIRYHRPPDHRI